MTIHFTAPGALAFRDAFARYTSARAAAIADRADEAAQAAWSAATDLVLGSWAHKPEEIAEKLVIAITEERSGPDLLRRLFWDLQRMPWPVELIHELNEARDVIADDLDAYRFSVGDDDGEVLNENEAALIEHRERHIERIDHVLRRAA